MHPTRACVVFVVSLSFACAGTDSSADSTPEPRPAEPAPAEPAPAEPAPVAEVCEHTWAVLTAEMEGAAEALGGFEAHMSGCVPGLTDARRTMGETKYLRQAGCLLAAASTAEMRACSSGPEPLASPREPARFPEGAEIRAVSQVFDNAIYTPDPDPEALRQTKAARFDKTDAIAVVAFCIDTKGATSDLHMVQPYPDDPQVDEILRDTIARWRFKPFIVDGATVKVCTERKFVFRFK